MTESSQYCANSVLLMSAMHAAVATSPPGTTPAPLIGGAPPARQVAPRRRLPSTRAVVGALLVTLAAGGALVVGTRGDGTPSTAYVVLIKAAAPGSLITRDMLEVRAMHLADDVAAQAFTDPSSVSGGIALGPLARGQLVQRAEIAPASSTAAGAVVGHEVTIPVDPARVPPGLRRGERVAVLATYGTASDARTVVTTQRAIVLGVSEADGGLASSRDTRLTLALDEPGAVLEIVHASQAAELTVVRATRADEPLPSTFSATTVKVPAAATTASTRATGK
jgi:hypothetical protein